MIPNQHSINSAEGVKSSVVETNYFYYSAAVQMIFFTLKNCTNKNVFN